MTPSLKIVSCIIVISHILCISTHVKAQIKPSSYFSDGVVLQRNIPNRIWGMGDPGADVKISLQGTSSICKVDNSGFWVTTLPPMPAGGPYEMTINSLRIKDVYIGEVWLCSGQSNMYFTLDMLNFWENEIKTANNPYIRMMRVSTLKSSQPEKEVKLDYGWRAVKPDSIGDFSAAAYFFGKKLYEKYKVPIGLISNSWGGSPAEAWMSKEALQKYTQLLNAYEERNARNEDIRKKQQQREELLKAWLQKAELVDAGKKIKGKEWYLTSCNISDWQTMYIPGYLENNGLKDFDGVVWFAREFELTQLPRISATLKLHKVDDMDQVWVNGVFVGSTDRYDSTRSYTIPAKILKKGKNALVIRLTDIGGNGGLYSEGMCIVSEKQTISLDGNWKYKIGVNFNDFKDYYGPDYRVLGGWMPSELYNAMIAPISLATFKGVIWYQGESNAGRAYQYRTLFPDLIADWRNTFQNGNFPFIYVQLANFLKPDSLPKTDPWPELREAQLFALTVTNTAMVTALDLGEIFDIHPKNKEYVGYRLAYAAMNIAYKETNVIPMGPIVDKVSFQNQSAIVTFKYAESGLVARGSDRLEEFALAGDDSVFYRANAKIVQGNKVEVSCPQVTRPIALRYAWANNPSKANLYNKAGLPASPFRTDDWPGVTNGKFEIE